MSNKVGVFGMKIDSIMNKHCEAHALELARISDSIKIEYPEIDKVRFSTKMMCEDFGYKIVSEVVRVRYFGDLRWHRPPFNSKD